MANPKNENWYNIEIPIVRGVIYLIQCNDLIKIGITRNFGKRYRKYVTENPYELKVIGMFQSDHINIIEDLIKDYWNKNGFRFRGEWYKLPEIETQSVIEFLT